MQYYYGFFAGTKLIFAFSHPDTASFYGNAVRPCSSVDGSIVIPEIDVREWMDRWDVSNYAYAEYVISCSYACDRLMTCGKTVFHGAAMLWNGRAYLFSAPSGTGKTTQLRLWQQLFPQEMSILNGDKPILDVDRQREVQVHPSPWKGKEGYGRDDIIAPLGGIILLRRASENSMMRMEPAVAARMLFGRVCSTFSRAEDVLNAAAIVEKIVTAVPVWLLCNKGDEDSALLTHRMLQKKEIGTCSTD